MTLKELKLFNFRKFGQEGEIDLKKPNLILPFNTGLNLIIGENDSGKTAIIDAIKIALKTSSYEWIKVDYDDFYKGASQFRIELKFSDFKDEEAKHFVEFLNIEKIGEASIPVLNLIFEANKYENRVVSSDLRAGNDGIGRPLPSEAREFLKVTYLKPLRDAQSELIPKKNSRIAQIFKEHEAFKNSDNHQLLDMYINFNNSIKSYFEGKDKDGNNISDTKGKELKNSIDLMIGSFFDDSTTTSIDVSDADLRKVLESLKLSLLEVQNPGLGALNRLFIASELIHINRERWDGARLGLIEEIEAHIHPQVQLKVIESLQTQNNIQLIITTHSPNLASKVDLEKIIICRNNSAYSLSHQYTKLDQKNYVFLEKFLDVTKASMFFAKGLIFVEGWSEEILIPAIAKKIGKDFVVNEVSIINVGNLGFAHYYKIFSREDNLSMEIPIAILSDCDATEYKEKVSEKSKQYTKSTDEVYKKEVAEAIAYKMKKYERPAFPYISDEWTFEWCLYKSSIFNSSFIEIVMEIHSKTKWDEFEYTLARKLFDRSLKKTEIAYKLAHKIKSGKINFSIENVNDDSSLAYILGAINHVCS
jgi:putative ATP-dependent endonuclease of the OLD family